MTSLRDRVDTGIQDMGIGSEGIHTKGLLWGVVKLRMERWIRWAIKQVLHIGLDPGDGLEEKGRSTRF